MKSFGLACHVGRNGKQSKTEAMYFPRPGALYEDEDTSDLFVDGGNIPFVRRFKYLGSIISSNLRDDSEIDARIKAAGAAFASARKEFFASKSVKTDHKCMAYEGLVLSILLYGCECWVLTARSLQRLRSFHNRCVRAMCRVSRWQTWQYRIRQGDLEQRVKVHPLDFYLARRRLVWAGHVARMDFEQRIPRKLLSSWVNHDRRQGRPQKGYGHGLTADLRNAGIDLVRWPELAADRPLWRAITKRDDVHVRPAQPHIYVSVCNSQPAHISPRPQPALRTSLPTTCATFAEVLIGLAAASLPVPQQILPGPPSPRPSSSPVFSKSTTRASPPPTTRASPPPSSPSPCRPRACKSPCVAPVRRSGRLAAMAAIRGGRKTYSNTQVVFS